jgi:adenine-specific DNA-methyltransferase
LPRVKEINWDEEAGQLVIPFEYRPLTEQEAITYGKKNQQEKIIEEALEEILKRLSPKKAAQALAALTAERHKTADGESVSFLEHHLRQYARRNTSDFFIHKDLKGFLTRELDFYLKNEVLNLDEIEAAGEERAEAWFQLMRVIKAIGGRIIEFLAQIEDFQKMLWEKRKFITETQYCITVGNIDESFYPDVAACDAQWAEWKELFHIDEEEANLFTSGKSKKDTRIAFLKAHPTLVLDTKHFDQDFTDRLLASFDDLDGITDGLLIYGDNFNALTLLLQKYARAIRCMYIDPPFNTGTDEFLYKDGYPHSSWLAMMESRVRIAQRLLADDGTFYAHIDYTEKERLKLLLDKYLSYITEIIWRIGWVSGYKSAAKKFIRNHDTIYQYGKTDSPLFIKTYIPYPEGYKRRDGDQPSGEGYPLEDTWNCSDIDQLHSIQIMSFSKEKVGNQALTQKNENLIARIVASSSYPGDMVLDYFLGSGTTAAVAHKMGRRYIGIEMGEHFFSYALPRMKRVLYGDLYGISSDVGWKGGGIFKYVRIESFEDTLNNIVFDDAAGQQALKFDDYLLKYMLKWETRKSETLLNVEKLARPFSYKLHIHTDGQTREKVVDIPETFNYLLGLHVKTRQALHDGDRRYLVYRGRIDHREIVVIWRETEGWEKEDFERDKKFVAEQKLTKGADEVFVNGDSFIRGAKALEPVFKARMFAPVEA